MHNYLLVVQKTDFGGWLACHQTLLLQLLQLLLLLQQLPLLGRGIGSQLLDGADDDKAGLGSALARLRLERYPLHP